MKFLRNNGILSSVLVSVCVSIIAVFLWAYGENIILSASQLFSYREATFVWWKLLFVLLIGTAFGILTEINGFKKTLPYFFGFSAFWLLLSFAVARYQYTDLLAIPVVLAPFFIINLVHFRKLWQIDSDLTENLVALASTGHLLEGKSADLRIESGLKLLETFFPVSELIVFRYEIDGKLNPIGRSRNRKMNSSLLERQDAWRKCVQLCESVMESRETIIQNDKTNEDSAKVVIPLVCEEIMIGVLYIDVRQDFEHEDQFLLESFSRQLARNLQRKELRNKKLPHNDWWSSFSTQSLENRLDITNLVHGIIKEQSFSAIANSYLKEAHAIAYLDGTLAYVNQQMKQLANLTSQDLPDTDLFKLLERFKTEVFNEPILAIRRVMQTGDSFECELDFSDDRKLGLQITLVKVPADNGSIHETNIPRIPACFLITFRDITANKENEKLRSDMANLMSHELRTPITSIQGFAEMLTLETDIPEDSREYLKIIADEANRASKILSNFLSVANLEQSDKQEITKSPVIINKVVEEVAKDYEKAAKNKRIRIVEQQSKDMPPISADRSLITKAVSNLVDNAIRYSPERTSVIISTILEPDFLEVSVEDRGYGIPRGEEEKIWQKFYRVAHDGQDKQEETTGLGLSLVKEIVEQHNGMVSVKSQAGRGSKFSFRLPRL